MRGLIGIIFFVQFVLVCIFIDKIDNFCSYTLKIDSAIICILSLLVFMKGCHLMWTSRHVRPVLSNLIYLWGGNDSSDEEYKSIERLKKYRDGKLSIMDNESAAKEYKKTLWLDGLGTTSGKSTKRAKKYINGKLSIMDNESAYKFLKGEE